MKKFFSLLTTALFLLNTAMAQTQFITVKGHQFYQNNKPYYYVGANYWYGGLLALQKDPARGKDRVRKELDFMRAHGITNLRLLAGPEGSGLVNGVDRVKPALQPERGKFNDDVLQSLDYLLAEMGKRQMHAVVFLSNNWEWSGGFLQYLNWNNQLSEANMRRKMDWETTRDVVSKFYTCDDCKADYLKRVAHILNHKNIYTGRTYINEPAIMAWELANEPRPMRPAAIDAYKKWTADAAQYIKNIDKNHLVTLGTEGDIGTETPEVFKDIHAPQQVDYLTIHIWPKNWGWFKDTTIAAALPQVIEKATNYANTNLQAALALNKPMVIEEFGLPRDGQSFSIGSTTNSRDKFYEAMFQLWNNSREKGGYIVGCNFWALGGFAKPIPGQIFWKDGDDYMGDPPMEEQGLNSVFVSDDSTWKVIAKYANRAL